MCYLDKSNEEACAVCEPSYVRVYPYNSCIKEEKIDY